MNIKYNSLLFLSFFLVVHSFCFGQLSPRETRLIKEFSKELADDVKDDQLHGSISEAVIKNGRVIWAAAFGYSSMSKDVAADSSNIYRIGSITKTFTSVVLMQLVQEGKVRLDDPVENYVPEVKALQGYSGKERITLRQLASHTSGLKREPDMPGANVGSLDQWESKLLSCIPYTSFNSRPGEKFLYSNIGVALLGLALERAAGMPYTQLVKERIFLPLQMDDTYFSIPEEKRGRLAEGIENNGNGNINTVLPLREIEGRGYRVPNGGIFSTPLDLSKFVIALMMGGSPLISPESLRQMQLIPMGGDNYGLGLILTRNGRQDLIGHNGSTPGYTSNFAIDQRRGYALILMRNYNVGKTNLEGVSRDLLERF